MKKSKFYGNYTKARDKAWEVILQNNINSLPVDLFGLAKSSGIKIKSYERGRQLFKLLKIEHIVETTDGFTTIICGYPYIFYDDQTPMPRQLFTIAHEMGHIFLEHNTENKIFKRFLSNWNGEFLEPDPQEAEANIFASRLLAPMCVLKELKITSYMDICRIAGISPTAAQIRYNRYLELLERNMFYKSPTEKKVLEKFEQFINSKKDIKV